MEISKKSGILSDILKKIREIRAGKKQQDSRADPSLSRVLMDNV
jgi:hypothetical protein